MRILNIGLFLFVFWASVRADAAMSAAAMERVDRLGARRGTLAKADHRSGAEGVSEAEADLWDGWGATAENGEASGATFRSGRQYPEDRSESGVARDTLPAVRAAKIMAGLGAQVRALGSYQVHFAVETGDGTVEGSYAVSGDRYYMRMGAAEVYCDGAVRYEVNNRMREVTVDAVDTTSRNILNNPTRAFDLAGDAFEAELLWERDGRAAVRLIPRSGQEALSAVTVKIDTQRMRPLSLEYDFDGDRIRIDILGLQGATAAPASFDRAAYAGYEWIDFR